MRSLDEHHDTVNGLVLNSANTSAPFVRLRFLSKRDLVRVGRPSVYTDDVVERRAELLLG